MFAPRFSPLCSMLHQLLRRFRTRRTSCFRIETVDVNLLLPVELHSEACQHLQKARKTSQGVSLAIQMIEKQDKFLKQILTPIRQIRISQQTCFLANEEREQK